MLDTETTMNLLIKELQDNPGSFLLFDRRTRRETWDAFYLGEKRGLLKGVLKEIDDQESQFRITLVKE